MRVIVIGAGVSGLSSAIRLLEAGQDVEIVAREAPAQTTSAVAAAIWYPYRAAPAERMLTWGSATYRELERLAAVPETGAVMREGVELFREPAPDPWWAATVSGFRHARPDELPEGFADGYRMRLPVADMSIYLGWLEREVLRLGGRITRRTVERIADLADTAEVVVNCAGLGARELVGDRSLFGVRGQVSVVDAPDVSRFVFDQSAMTVVIPRVSDVVIGVTAEEQVEEVAVDPSVATALRTRAAQLVPTLATARVLADRAGIRPCRPTIRLEREVVDGLPVVHNYGHGGAGVTLSWGCANEVARLVTGRAT